MLKKLEKFNLPEIEEGVLKFWKERQIFEKSLEKTTGNSVRQARSKVQSPGKKFVFYEGPPTANAKPGIHHVFARAFKDIVHSV